MADLERLEERVAEDRAALASSFDALTDTLSTERIATELNATVKGYGGEIGAQAIKAAKENPAAFALVGAGLALLLSGAGRRGPASSAAQPAGQAMEGFDARVAKADAAMKAEMSGTSMSPTALKLRASLDRGLDKLPDGARRRVLKARKAALDAQERVEAQARKTAKDIHRAHRKQPMVTGALAFGLGAVIAAFLPGTRREDELLGTKRDALMAEAQRVMSDEMANLRASASSAVQDIANQTAAQ